MKLFLECTMGASGDMLMGALYELLPDKFAFREKMDRLRLPDVTYEYSASEKCGISGTRVIVRIGGAEEKSEDVSQDKGKGPGSGGAKTRGQPKNANVQSGSRRYDYKGILDLIRGLGLPDNVLEDALGVYKIIGEAEATVHGVTISKVHLHEIGSLDAVADIVGCCLLINMLGVTEIAASPVHVGAGQVRCEHGILPVPAPAAAEILKGVPIYGGQINGELCTPTGAALLKYFVTRFGEMLPVTVVKIGCGMGAKDFEAANCLRAFLCEDDASCDVGRENIFELSCNLDDMTPEAVGAIFEVLFENGALDVYTTPIMMKKNRSAVMLSCLCAKDKRDCLTRLMLEHTTTLGVRVTSCDRDVLSRSTETVTTKYGDIRVKHAQGYGAVKMKPEYDDVQKAAKKHGVPFTTVYNEAMHTLKHFS